MKMGINRLNVSKTTAIIFATAMTLSMIAISLPIVNAQGNPTCAFISVAPNPTGVGQEVTILMWLDKINPTASGPQGGRFEGYALTITKPDGSVENRGPFTADPASFAYDVYTPSQIGTYTLKFDFPGQQYFHHSFRPDAVLTDRDLHFQVHPESLGLS